MKHNSRKRQARIEEARAVRDKFAADHPICQWPHCRFLAVDTHEIARGPVRAKALDKPFALLNLCRTHHDHTHHRPNVARDLAVKMLSKDGTYDLSAFNALRGTPFVTEFDVHEAILWLGRWVI